MIAAQNFKIIRRCCDDLSLAKARSSTQSRKTGFHLMLHAVKTEKRNPGICWIDYKAHDMVPQMLKVVGVARLLRRSMHNWMTVLTENNELLGKVNFNRGNFQE